ncbi:MAG: hypothetical protein LBG17_05500 [Bacteroidales bacterium]|jgi:hypothetical protein|nr:hypothetical protein [Bacteroidales bacterium]
MEQYKTTKTVRFKLDPKNADIIEQDVKAVTSKNGDFDLISFVSKLTDFISNTKNYLFYLKRNKEFAVKDKIIIKREWLRVYAKQEYVNYNSHNRNNGRRQQITIDEIIGLATKIKDIFDEISRTCAALANDAILQNNERARRERYGLLLKRLQAKNALPVLISLIENTIDKNEQGNLSMIIKNQTTELQRDLLAGIQEYLPAQSSGLPVAKASFNYYTLNKKPVDFAQETKKLQDEMVIKDWNKDDALRDFSSMNKEMKEKIKEGSESNYEKLRQFLKNTKALQKAKFNELAAQGLTYDSLQRSNELYLFKDVSSEHLEYYKKLTNKIEKKATEINQCDVDNQKKQLRIELRNLKNLRGSLITAANKNNSFKTYKQFANLYRKVAQKHGKILAKLKEIEREQTESQMLKYWAVIMEKNNQHLLVLIPREKAGECKKYLESQQIDTGAIKAFLFESFTYRSLQKLCFGYLENGTNSFNEGIKAEVQKMPRGEFEFQGREQDKIEFYKNVLGSNYAKQVLNIPKQVQTDVVLKDFASLDDFKIALEKICYVRLIVCNDKIENILQEQYGAQIFNITSSDLRSTSTTHSDKRHTKIWREFWDDNNDKNNFEIRLNPEITVTYRQPKESRVKKYGKESDKYDEKKKNRYLHPQFTLITTISEHSNTPAKQLAFITDEEFKKSVEIFNKKFNEENIKFAIGLDNGEIELSTLGIYLPCFDKSTNEEKIEELQKVKDYGFEVLTIKNLCYTEKDKNDKDRKVVQNPSYFMDKDIYCRTFGKNEDDYNKMFDEIFEKKNVLTLDLTIAKVINGNIVTNGDVSAFLNLWLKHAQRNIYEMNDHSEKETAKEVKIEDKLTDEGKAKFAEYISDKNKYDQLSDEEKQKYLKWIFEDRENITLSDAEKKEFGKCQKIKGNFSKEMLFAICYIGEGHDSASVISDVRNVFKVKEEFYSIVKDKQAIKAMIEGFNIRKISNEELDLKINNVKQALVANVIGVIDFLYKQYKQRFNGEGLIVKEGFGVTQVEQSLERFSGNIYRILERKLYQKFQNYGLVPPIKNLMTIRENKVRGEEDLLRFGNIGFVNEANTSQECPVCTIGRLKHTTICSENCGFSTANIMHSNDGIAGFNIAKRGFENFLKKKHVSF